MVDGDPDATARIVLDFQRAGRIGLDEAVLAGSKSIHQLETIIDMARGQGVRLLFTRLSAEQFGALREERKSLLDYDVVSETAILGEPHAASRPASVCIISAGATDARAPCNITVKRRRSLMMSAWQGCGGLWNGSIKSANIRL